MELLDGLTSPSRRKHWCHVLDQRIDAGELDGSEIGAVAAVVGWAAVEEVDAEVRAAMLGSLLDLGRHLLLPAQLAERVVEQVYPAGLDAAGSGLLRAIAALSRYWTGSIPPGTGVASGAA